MPGPDARLGTFASEKAKTLDQYASPRDTGVKWLSSLGMPDESIDMAFNGLQIVKRILPNSFYVKLRSIILNMWDIIQDFTGLFKKRATRRLHGINVYIDSNAITPTIRRQILSRSYEGAEFRAVKEFITKDDVVMELGAGLGVVSIICAKIASGSNVHSYEANPDLEKIIQENYMLNHVQPNLKIALLGRGAGVLPFYVSDEFWSSSLIEITGAKRIDVAQLDLNSEIRRIKPTCLVIDIEGGEADIIDQIDPGTISKLIMEWHPHVLGEDAIAKMRSRLSYLGYTEHDFIPRHGASEPFQVVFIRNV